MSLAIPTPRPATAADLPAVERLLAAADLPIVGVAEILGSHPGDFLVVDDPATPGEFAAAAGLEVCAAAPAPATSASAHLPSGSGGGAFALLRSVAVRPSWRGSGLGEALVRGLVDAAGARGLDALYLLTTTAEHYFPRLGFVRVERAAVPAPVQATLEFTSACPASAVPMTLSLPAEPASRGALRGPFRVLVLCTGNSARSQIAEALLATRSGGRVAAASAGSRPAARVNPYAVEVLAAHGILWTGRTPKSLDDVACQAYDLVVTVCDNARDACPYFPSAAAQVHWGLPDPADEAEPAAARRAFAATYDALAARVDALLALPLESLDGAALQAAAQAVHERAAVPA